MDKLNLAQQNSQWQTLTGELGQSIDPKTEDHWNRKILDGIVPTEVLKRGPVDPVAHSREVEKLADFEAHVVLELYENQWKPGKENRPGQLHYFGIGTGQALAKVRKIANLMGDHVVAYDVCEAGYNAGIEAFRGQSKSADNLVLLADIRFACQKKYIRPKKATKLMASRVLDVLDTQESGKMAETARRIGSLLSFLDALIMHPCSDDNPHAIWGDTTPCRLDDVVGHMQEGRGPKRLEVTRLGKESFHGHIYTLALIRGKE